MIPGIGRRKSGDPGIQKGTRQIDDTQQNYQDYENRQRRGNLPRRHVIDHRSEQKGQKPGDYQRQYDGCCVFKHNTNGHQHQDTQKYQGNFISIDIYQN